jgi:hypothetical protein
MLGSVGSSTSTTWSVATRPLDRQQGDDAKANDSKHAGKPTASSQTLSPDQLRMISELQARDREVRAHESAHKAVAGSLAGGMSFSYQSGPDGRRYAIGGEVAIDTGAERDPRATISKMQRVAAAALAPAQPSAQDRAIAAQSRAAMAAAQRELLNQEQAASAAQAAQRDKPYETDTSDQDTGRQINLIA